MDRVGQCLNLLVDIAACYGKVLGFRFFCKRIRNFGDYQDPNYDVRLFIQTLIDNINFKSLMVEKKRFFD